MFKRSLLIISFLFLSVGAGTGIAYIQIQYFTQKEFDIGNPKEANVSDPDPKETDPTTNTHLISEKETFSEMFLDENDDMSLDDILALNDKRKQFVLLCRYTDHLSSEDFPAFIEKITIHNLDLTQWAIRMFAKRDFEAARQLITENAGLTPLFSFGNVSWKTNLFMQPVFEEWLIKDKQGAIAFFKEMKNENRYYTRDFLFSLLIDKYPLDALAIITDESQSKWVSMHYYSSIFTTLYEKNPILAMDSLREIDSEYARNEALRGILSKMTDSDPMLALDTIRSELSKDDQISAFQSFCSNLIWSQPDVAVELFKRETFSKEERETLVNYIYNLNSKDLVSFLQSAELDESESRSIILSHLSSHADTAKEYQEILTSFLPESEKEQAEETLITHLSYNSAEEAIARWNNLPEERRKLPLLTSILRNMSWRSPKEAIALMEHEMNNFNLSDEDRKELMDIAINNISPEHLQDAEQFINTYGTEEAKENMTLRRMLQNNQNDSLAILNFISDMKDQSAAQSAYYDQIQSLINYRPDELITYLINTPRQDWKNSGIDSAMNQLVHISLDASEDFMDQIPKENPLYQNALASFVEYAFEYSPKRALDRASEITSETVRNRIIEDMVQRWKSQNLQAADAWLKENNITFPRKQEPLEVEFE